MVCFAEALIVHDFPLPQELDGLGHIRVVGKAQDVVVAEPRLLLCCKVLVQIGYGVAGDGKGCRGERHAGGSLGIYACGVVHEIVGKTRLLNLLGGKAASQLVDDSADHFKVG